VRLRILVACIIFIGSYLPLSLILLAQNYDYNRWCKPPTWVFFGWPIALKNPGFGVGIFGACLICFLLTLPALTIVPARQQITITKIEHTPADLMNYVLPYVVSFMSIDYQDTGKFVGFLIFLGWMFLITYKSGRIILNQVLTVLGWRLYKIAYKFPGDEHEYSGQAISRKMLAQDERYQFGAIQDVLVVK
jgi:hypothetical protein